VCSGLLIPACVLSFLLGCHGSASVVSPLPCRRPCPDWILTIHTRHLIDHTGTDGPCGTMDHGVPTPLTLAGTGAHLRPALPRRDGAAPHRGRCGLSEFCVRDGESGALAALANSNSGREGQAAENPGDGAVVEKAWYPRPRPYPVKGPWGSRVPIQTASRASSHEPGPRSEGIAHDGEGPTREKPEWSGFLEGMLEHSRRGVG